MLRSGAELSAKVRKGEPELVEEAGTRSAGLRVMQGKRVASTSTSDLTEAGIERFVADAIELVGALAGGPVRRPGRPEAALRSRRRCPTSISTIPPAARVDAAQAIAIATEGEAAASPFDPRITNSEGATFGRTAGGSALVLSSGFRATYKGSYQSLSVVPVAADEGGKNRRGYHWTARRYLAELDPPPSVGREAARRTLRKLGARTVSDVRGARSSSTRTRRARSSGMLAGCVMGSSIWRKSSYLVGREGTRVASDLVTVVDDPLIPRAPGLAPVRRRGAREPQERRRREGHPAHVPLRQLLGAQARSREHRERGARRRAPASGPSTSNFILQPGTDSNEAIVKGTKRGPLRDRDDGLRLQRRDRRLLARRGGFWIENGELAYPVSEVTISLNVDELWQRIDAVGSDLDLRTSTASPTLASRR